MDDKEGMIEQLKRHQKALREIINMEDADSGLIKECLQAEIDILDDIIHEGLENIKNLKDGNFTRDD